MLLRIIYFYRWDLPICWDLSIILCGYIYELMTWLVEVYDIYFRCDVLFVEICMHVSCELFHDVTSISWIFIIFAWFIALIEVGRYTFNHIQFQDTHMYILKPMGLVKAFTVLQSSCDYTLLWDWINSKPTFKVYINIHKYWSFQGYNMVEDKVGYIWESRQTNTLKLVHEDSLFEILWQLSSTKPVISFIILCHNQCYVVLTFIFELGQII